MRMLGLVVAVVMLSTTARAAEVCLDQGVCIDGDTMVYDGHKLYFQGRVGDTPVQNLLDCDKHVGISQAQGQEPASGEFGEKSVAAELCRLAAEQDQGA